MKAPQKSLKNWTKQKWRTKSGKPSAKTGERYLPEAAIKSLSSAEYAATTKAKREGKAKGKGIAFEAAQAVRSWAYSKLGFTTITSNILPKNKRSIALAKRLNATYEKEYHNDNMGHCYMYRHPYPEKTENN